MTGCCFAACDQPAMLLASFGRPCCEGDDSTRTSPVCSGHAMFLEMSPTADSTTKCRGCGALNQVACISLQGPLVAR